MKGSRILYIILIVAVIASVVVGLSGIGLGSKPATTPTPQLTSTPPGEYSTYTDQAHGFSISYPQGWAKISEDLYPQGVLVSYTSGTACGGAPVILNVGSNELSSAMTVQAYFQAVLNEYSQREGYQFISQEQLTVSGLPAVEHIYTMVSGDLTGEAMQVFVIKGTTAWYVSCESATSCWTAYKSIFDTLAGSFTLLD